MNATVHQLPSRADAVLTKSQLAQHLGRSTRWVEQRQAEGMPKGALDRYGRRKYSLEACQAWLAEGHERPKTKLEELEQRVSELERRIEA